MPITILIMVCAHVDILSIERCNPNLILLGHLLLVMLVLRYSLKLFGGLVGLIDDGSQFFHIHRTIVVHAVLIGTEVLDQIHKHLGLGFFQLLLTHEVAIGITRSHDTILTEECVIETLVFLIILTLLQDTLDERLVGFLIHLGMVQHLLQQSQGRLHILVQTTQVDGDDILPDICIETTSQLIELLLDLSSRQLVSTQEIQIFCRHVITLVCTLAKLITERQLEQSVLFILHIIQRQTFFTFFPFYL